MILLLDNYDSFVHNLARYLRRLGQTTLVVRNDAIGVEQIRRVRPDAIVLSPGPCTPNEAGCSLVVVRELWSEVPLLGICLGHQAIAAAFGARIVRSPQPMHGRTSEVLHGGRGMFAGIPCPATVCRYHSLVVERSSLPDVLHVTASTADGVVMAIQHDTAPVVGLQFHPEAVLTENGYRFLCNFLYLAGLEPAPAPDYETEWRRPVVPARPLPQVPVTF